jgi:pyruvate-formate lyase-activating enzyme
MNFHIMAKPHGALCNLDCTYCYYLEKEKLYGGSGQNVRMSDATLDEFVRQYIEAQATDVIRFAWPGGEPTLLGIAFFERVVALQQRYAQGRMIENAVQTNGTLLDDDWGAFLARHRFLVGLSIDGPRARCLSRGQGRKVELRCCVARVGHPQKARRRIQHADHGSSQKFLSRARGLSVFKSDGQQVSAIHSHR